MTSFLYSCHEQHAIITEGVLLIQSLWKQGGCVSLVLLSPQFVFTRVVLSQNFQETMVDTSLFLVPDGQISEKDNS